MLEQNYLPILIFLVVATAMGVVPLTLGWLFGPRRPDQEKNSPYECGFEAFEDSRMKFDVRYYLVANPVHHLRPRDRLPVSVGGRPRRDRHVRLRGP